MLLWLKIGGPRRVFEKSLASSSGGRISWWPRSPARCWHSWHSSPGGYVGAASVRAVGGDVATRVDLRLVWGAGAFPQVFALLLLLPLDLLIVGTDTFTSERLDDPLATGWAAFSIAMAVSLTVWSVYLFVRGVERAGSISIAASCRDRTRGRCWCWERSSR